MKNVCEQFLPPELFYLRGWEAAWEAQLDWRNRIRIHCFQFILHHVVTDSTRQRHRVWSVSVSHLKIKHTLSTESSVCVWVREESATEWILHIKQIQTKVDAVGFLSVSAADKVCMNASECTQAVTQSASSKLCEQFPLHIHSICPQNPALWCDETTRSIIWRRIK